MAKHKDAQTDMVLVMGVTRAGTSYLTNKLQEGAVVEEDGLESSKQAFGMSEHLRG